MPNKERAPTDETMKPANILYPPRLLKRAEEASKWKGLKKAAYFRMALEQLTREVERERERFENNP